MWKRGQGRAGDVRALPPVDCIHPRLPSGRLAWRTPAPLLGRASLRAQIRPLPSPATLTEALDFPISTHNSQLSTLNFRLLKS